MMVVWMALLSVWLSPLPTHTHAYPNGYVWGCTNISATLPFCNTSLPLTTRLSDLITRLTLTEKLNLLGANTITTGVGSCTCMDSGVDRLGIPSYLHLVETNSAVASMCVSANVCATEFPAPACLAASFNRTVWDIKGRILSDEMRAFNNINWMRGTDNGHAYIGLTGFGPNINIVRDPRFGRNSELPSEDPYLAGTYASHYVRNGQFGSDSRYLKMVMGLKHFDAYSVENGRAWRNFNISIFDLFDTYLSQYEIAFKEGQAKATMCAYSSVNGVPMCANDFLLNGIIRGKWGMKDVVVVTDCGAINNMVDENKYSPDKITAAADAINGGSDVDFGDQYYPTRVAGGNDALLHAINQGKVQPSTVDISLARVLEKRFQTGQFDPLDHQVYTKYGVEMINASSSWDFVLDTALQGLVLLKNDNNVLPFMENSDGVLAVLGPHVYSQRDLFEDYKGDEECFGGGDGCVRTIASVFQQMYPGTVLVEEGVPLSGWDPKGIPAAIDAADAADHIVLCIGIGNEQEHEGKDRETTLLPGWQETFALQVLAMGKPTVVVLINGGIVSLNYLLPETHALIEAFYPAMRTGEALYNAIFGRANRWGKLPVTIYPPTYIAEVDMYDFNMTAGPGRTYRYYKGKAEFEFGYGLSYTTFGYECLLNIGLSAIACNLTNTGGRTGDEVLQVYHTYLGTASHPLPIRSLVDFHRVTLDSGASTNVLFWIQERYFLTTDNSGNRVIYDGTHRLVVTNGYNAAWCVDVVLGKGTVISSHECVN